MTTVALFGLGGLSGPVVDRFGPQRVLLIGAVSLGSGLSLRARATSLRHAYLGHGAGVGLAVACAYVPVVAVVGGWFERRRTLAVGVARQRVSDWERSSGRRSPQRDCTGAGAITCSSDSRTRNNHQDH